MSEFLTQLDPWMEEECFNAIMSGERIHSHSTVKFVQVVERRSSSLYVLSDCHAIMLCTCTALDDENIDDKDATKNTSTNNKHSYNNDNNSTGIERGAIVQLQSYKIVVASAASTNHSAATSTTTANPSSSSARKTTPPPQQQQLHQKQQPPRLSLLINTPPRLVGAQGMGIIGAPVDIHDTIQVRRALQESPTVIRQLLLQSACRRKKLQSKPESLPVGVSHINNIDEEDCPLTQDFATPNKTRETKENLTEETKNTTPPILKFPNQRTPSPTTTTTATTSSLVIPRNGNPLALLQNEERLNRILLGTQSDMDETMDEDDDTQPESNGETNNAQTLVETNNHGGNDTELPEVNGERTNQEMSEVGGTNNNFTIGVEETNDDEGTIIAEKATNDDTGPTSASVQQTKTTESPNIRKNNFLTLLANAVHEHSLSNVSDSNKNYAVNDGKDAVPSDDESQRPLCVPCTQQRSSPPPPFPLGLPLKRPFKRGLSQVLCTDDEGEPDDEPDTQAPVTRSVFDRHVDDDNEQQHHHQQQEYHLPLKLDTASSSSKRSFKKKKTCRARSKDERKESVSTSRVPPPQLDVIEEKGNESNSDEDDDDDNEPLGISEMLLPEQKQQHHDDDDIDAMETDQPSSLTITATLTAPTDANANATKPTVIKSSRPDFLSVTTPRETSTETLETSHVRRRGRDNSADNVSAHSAAADATTTSRFRKARNFYMKLWEQRKEATIVFR